MILILLFVVWLAVACLVDRYIGQLRDRFMPALHRHQGVMIFWIALGTLILATNEALLVPKLLTLLPVAAAHVHLSARQPQDITWRTLLHCMAERLRHAFQRLRKSGDTRP